MAQLRSAIIVCSRSDSRRLPRKPHIVINNETILSQLIKRCGSFEIPVFISAPISQHLDYFEYPNGHFIKGYDDDPLGRMYQTAKTHNIDVIIRVTHDKILVNKDQIKSCVDEFIRGGHDYLVTPKLPAGCGFEIFSFHALETAANNFKNVEHISYAIRSIATNICESKISSVLPNHRFLIDYPEDLQFFNVLFAALGNSANDEQIKTYLLKNTWARKINQLPEITVYTCAYNAQKWIADAMMSVFIQQGFSRCEYIIIDDCSTDNTNEIIARFCQSKPNCRWIRNGKNLGLAASSNLALSEAKGKYIVRLDADDYFTGGAALSLLKREIESFGSDVIYPANYFGDMTKVQKPNAEHHAGGAIFKTSALNYLKFSDKLRGYEGLDLYQRARTRLKIGYLNAPIFFYRQHEDSMSKTNLEQRAKIKDQIMASV